MLGRRLAMSTRGQGNRPTAANPEPMTLDRNSLEQIADGLALAFYLLILGSLFAVITASLGFAFFMLVVAAAAHAGRWALEEVVAARGDEARIELDPSLFRYRR
jgi:hypothetical protein